MSMEVLKDGSQIKAARAELKRRGISQLVPVLGKIVKRLRSADFVDIGDQVKSWDVLRTLQFLEESVEKDQAILDIGCYASEILMTLRAVGYSNLTGADLNPEIKDMPFQDEISYEITDFMKTPFADASFSAITSMSVIEHGYNQSALLAEMSRLLTPGGYFVASFDYWPEKIDTTGVKFFDMEWIIFSKTEIDSLLEEAAGFGLFPAGEMQQGASGCPIKCGGKEYTFGWMVLQKKQPV